MLKKEEFVKILQRVLSPDERRVEEAAGLTTAFTNYAEECPEFLSLARLRQAHVLAAFLLEFGSRHPYPPEPEEAGSERARCWEHELERESRLTVGLPKGWEVCENRRVSDASFSLFTVIMERLIKKSYDPGIRTYLTEEGKVVVLSIEEIREKLGLKSLLAAQTVAERAAVEYQYLEIQHDAMEDDTTVTKCQPAFQYAVASQNSFEAKIADEFAVGLTQTWCADKNALSESNSFIGTR